MFYGEFLHNIDAKNRIIIPSKFREVIQEKGIEKLYLTRGFDSCLFLFSDAEWRNQENKFKDMPFTKKDVRKFKRMFFSGAVELAPDKQWRVLVPDYLKEFAGLDSEIKIVGVSDRIELWDIKKWNEFYNSSKESFEDIAENLLDI
ncbi:MAG: division/cell wall cluster transcriptional repressor MraZ [Candidatus Omnitrophica bacterium]|nr:division/cell wall cluster transcriptional repressor MraZ [Candidatus Omnitrophota bacterium]